VRPVPVTPYILAGRLVNASGRNRAVTQNRVLQILLAVFVSELAACDIPHFTDPL
jgi:hypothetical protein